MITLPLLGLTMRDRFFFFTVTPTTEIYTLSLHDALPISRAAGATRARSARPPRGGARAQRPKAVGFLRPRRRDRKSTRLNSSHPSISYAVFCLKKKKTKIL